MFITLIRKFLKFFEMKQFFNFQIPASELIENLVCSFSSACY